MSSTDFSVGWCTNILPTRSAKDLASALHALSTHLPQGVPIGLWLPDTLIGDDPVASIQPIRKMLDQIGSPVLGLNAFPQHDFHAARVKDDVYRPSWAAPDRADYTIRAAKALVALREGDSTDDELGLTTVPIGWTAHAIDLKAAAEHLNETCRHLQRIGQQAGRTVFLAIEPEPGCILSTAHDVSQFVATHDLEWACRDGVLRACLDACHLAVENESPQAALESLSSVDMSIGRIQVSSAIEARDSEGIAALQLLDEPRWMHQTNVFRDDQTVRYGDLPEALHEPASGIWRTHMHVPVHRNRFGPLHSTQSWIVELLKTVAATDERPAIEVETYAWDVLPDSFRLNSMHEEITRELTWTTALLESIEW